MKKLAALVLAMMLVLTAAVAGAETITLTLNDTNTNEHPTGMANVYFAELVKEATEGRIVIDVFNGGTLYTSEPDAIEAAVIGDLAFTRVSAAPVCNFVPELNAIQLPYLYKNSDHMWGVLNGEIGQGLLDQVQESGSGLIGLCYYDSGSRCFYTREQVVTPADLAGKKIRMMDNQMMCKMTELLGGTPVTGIGPSDIYSAIETGVIDGAENNYVTYYTKGDYKAAMYYVLDHHLRVPEILLASESALADAGVTDEDIALLKELAKEAQAYEIEQWNIMTETYRDALIADGVVVTELTDEQVAEYQALVEPIWTDPAYGGAYADLIAKIQAEAVNY